MKKEGRHFTEKIIEGSMATVCLAEAAHLAALFFELPLHVCAAVTAGLFLCAFAVTAARAVWRRRGRTAEEKKESRFLKLLKVYPWLFALIGALILAQIVWNDVICLPYLRGDITGETVQSFLASDAVYAVNPMTGQVFETGMPMRIRILVLPTLYAVIIKWTGGLLPVSVLCYGIIPALVLLLSYTVYCGWAVYLFPDEGKKQAVFLLFVALVFQFGCYSAAMDGYGLFFAGWQGTAIRMGVLLPYALLKGLQGRWRSVLLCAAAEVCIVWTFYGLGYTAVIAAVVLGIRLVQFMKNGRKRYGKTA